MTSSTDYPDEAFNLLEEMSMRGLLETSTQDQNMMNADHSRKLTSDASHISSPDASHISFPFTNNNMLDRAKFIVKNNRLKCSSLVPSTMASNGNSIFSQLKDKLLPECIKFVTFYLKYEA